ncbi:hypothetical protein B0H14DRAFT_2642770 [Mycena olivaceomarginata]|nr:hypothetical protein B0H14DRAFT_2642770 [Mycena olivaceomarginata]
MCKSEGGEEGFRGGRRVAAGRQRAAGNEQAASGGRGEQAAGGAGKQRGSGGEAAGGWEEGTGKGEASRLLVPPKYSVCILRFMDDSPGAGSQTCSVHGDQMGVGRNCLSGGVGRAQPPASGGAGGSEWSRALDVSRLIPSREMGDVSYCRIALILARRLINNRSLSAQRITSDSNHSALHNSSAQVMPQMIRRQSKPQSTDDKVPAR